MSSTLPRSPAPAAAHAVLNQPPPLEGRNLFADDVALAEALERDGGARARERLHAAGAFWGGEPMAWGAQANAHPPVLHTPDRFGHRVDEVEFHPAWHELMPAGVRDGLHALPWTTAEPGAHAARAALYQCAVQAEAGFGCPLTMTFAAVPVLQAEPELAAEWVPRLTAGTYDPELKPGKPSALCGMAMTEK